MQKDVDALRVVVVGLGGIGGGIAHRMSERGRHVIGVDLDRDRANEWQQRTGCPAVSSLDSVEWDDVRCVFIAVRTAPQVDVVLADHGVRRAMDGGASAFVVTTMTPSDARRTAEAHRGRRVFELPVSGGEIKAREGELTGLMTGPHPTAFEKTLLQDIFSTLFQFDDYGQPSLLKLVNNTLAARNLLNAAAAVATAHEHGVDAFLASNVIRSSSGSSVAGDALIALSDNQIELLRKDARLLGDELSSSPLDLASMNDIVSIVGAAQGLLTTAHTGRTRS